MKVLDVPKNTHKDTLNFTHRFRQSTGVRLRTRSLEPESDSVSSHRSHSSSLLWQNNQVIKNRKVEKTHRPGGIFNFIKP